MNNLVNTQILKEQSDELYSHYFGSMIQDILSKYKLNDKISDEELEMVLTDLPIALITVSDNLASVKLVKDNLKIEMTTVSAEEKLEYRKAISIYSSVIDRTEKELSYCREVIMVAKKFWDSRQATKNAMPIKEVDLSSLPDYYIKGV